MSLLKLSRLTLDENEVDRDFRIRRRINAIYNKTESDFMQTHPNNYLDAFKDYEEMREDIIYNLVHEVDVAQTEAQVKAYEASNLVEITNNQAKRQEEINREINFIRAQDEARRKRVAAEQVGSLF